MTYETYIIRSIVSRKPIELEYIPETLIGQAKKNKVLYVLGLNDSRIRKTEAWMELEMRRIVQRKSIIEASELAEKLGIRILVIKTLKPFNYVPDDVDILVIDDEDLRSFVNALLKRGYFIRKKGTSEITLRRIVSNTFVDLDIHTKMGAGPYEYLDKYYLWQRRVYRKLDGESIATPNDVDELLITVAHAILKEFTVTLADIMHVISSASFDRKVIYEATLQAKHVGLSKSLRYLLNLAYQTYVYSFKIRKQCRVDAPNFPHKVPILVIINAYLENLRHRFKMQGLKPIKELLKAPSSKGIATLLRYVGI